MMVMLRRAKYRFLEAGLNQAPSKSNTTSRNLLRAISVYKQTAKEQWQSHTRTCQDKRPGRHTSAQAAALEVKSGNNKIIYEDILTALASATNDLSMPCLEQWTGTATDEE